MSKPGAAAQGSEPFQRHPFSAAMMSCYDEPASVRVVVGVGKRNEVYLSLTSGLSYILTSGLGSPKLKTGSGCTLNLT